MVRTAGQGQAIRNDAPSRWADVWAHQRPDPTAVDRRHLPEIDEQVSRAVAKQRLHALLELFGGTAGDERLLRRQHDAAADRVLSNSHVKGWRTITCD